MARMLQRKAGRVRQNVAKVDGTTVPPSEDAAVVLFSGRKVVCTGRNTNTIVIDFPLRPKLDELRHNAEVERAE
jgi:hypothetical protein